MGILKDFLNEQNDLNFVVTTYSQQGHTITANVNGTNYEYVIDGDVNYVYKEIQKRMKNKGVALAYLKRVAKATYKI